MALERCQHRHYGIYHREELDDLVGSDVGKVKVESCLDVVLRAGRIEAFEIDVPHVGGGDSIGHLEAAVAHHDIRSHPVDAEVRVVYIVGFQRDIRFNIGRDHDQGKRSVSHFGHGILRLGDEFRNVFRGGISGSRSFRPVVHAGTVSGQELIGIDLLRSDLQVEFKRGAPHHSRPDIGHLSPGGNVGAAGIDGNIVQGNPVVVGIEADVGNRSLQREIRSVEKSVPDIQGGVHCPLSQILRNRRAQIQPDILES